MGNGVSVLSDNTAIVSTIDSLDEDDFEKLLAENVDFNEAYQSLRHQVENADLDGSSRSIQDLAIRQLSSNLKSFRLHESNIDLMPKSSNNDSYSKLVQYIDSAYDDDQTNDASSNTPAAQSVKKVVSFHRPNLKLNMNSDADSLLSENNSPSEWTYSNHDQQQRDSDCQAGNALKRIPSDRIRISPHGTFQIGKWRIRETGLSPSVDVNQLESAIQANPFRRPLSPDINNNSSISAVSIDDFVEIGSLGSGASGFVIEALHIPTLTIVALKMLHVHNDTKRKQLSRELEVLYKNLTELKLVNETLGSTDILDNLERDSSNDADSLYDGKCKNILSFYNAFVDSKSGMINIVIEYMDGGSLQVSISKELKFTLSIVLREEFFLQPNYYLYDCRIGSC